jgi:dUTP pyrophosphatase
MQGYFSMEDAQAKLLKTLDPNSNYTMDDFITEYSNGNMLGDNEFSKIKIDFINQTDNQDPDWETSGSAGFDLRASEHGSIKPNEFKVVPTGLFFDLPIGFEMQIRPRSGLAAKHGITVLNSPGTIDSDYTGEIKVILINHGDKIFEVAKGDRIAQAVIASVTAKNIIALNKVNEITKETDRGIGGFGSTGIK